MFRIEEMNGKFQVYHDFLLLATFRSPEAAKSYLAKSQEKFQAHQTSNLTHLADKVVSQ